MQLQRVIRAVTCAALCAALFAGAALFPARTAAGQEINSVTSGGEAAAGQLNQDGREQELRAALTRARYGITRAADTPLGRWAWHAPNPAAGYDAYITEEGVTIVVGGEPYVSLRLRGIGYGTGLRAVAPGQVSGDGQTVNLTRDGSVQEWYVNSPDGLEQGFTLAKPPASRRPGVPLRLGFRISEGWQAAASADGRKVTMRGAGGSRVVEYGKLAVRDRTGRDIPARLTAAGEEVFIEVEDGGAAYPLTIDPVFSLQEKLPAADASAQDAFGYSLALSGDTAVVSAYGDNNAGPYMDRGSVYVFTRAGGVWTLQQKLNAGDGGFYDHIGSAVAISGDTIVVGAREDMVGANYFQGSAYVFTRSNGVWTEQQRIVAPDGAESDSFGTSVAVSGDTLVVGSVNDTVGSNYQQGSAYVFTRGNGVWTFRQKLIAPNGDGEPYEAYGVSVALGEGTLAVGAYLDDIGHLPNSGSVYVYARGHAGWVLEKKLVAADREFGECFGFSVALDGETLAVGAYRDWVGENPAQGSVYVYTRGGGAWPQQQKLTANDGDASDNFGYSVALSGDTLAVGAKADGNIVFNDHGAAYVYRRGDGVWTEQQKITAGDAELFDDFGHAVAVGGDTVLVSAPGDDVGKSYDEGGDRYDQGSVYVFRLPSCPTIMFKPLVLPDGLSNVSYEQPLTVSGGAGPFEFTHLAGSLPPGVSLSPSGVLSGTPTTAGTYHFMVLATDTSSGCGSVHDYTLTVESSPVTLGPSALLKDGRDGDGR